MPERHILARVHWLKALSFLLSPFLFLTVSYFALSNRPLHRVFSLENLISITPSRPIPVILVAFGFLFLALIIKEIIKLCSYKGVYLYIEDGYLKRGRFVIEDLTKIDEYKVTIKKTGILRDLVLSKIDGTSKIIPLSFGKYNHNLVLENMISLIKLAKRKGEP